jgi:hypothetical protein
MRNKYPAKCFKCGKIVKPDDGYVHPPEIVAKMDAETFFPALAHLMQLYPPPPQDAVMVRQLLPIANGSDSYGLHPSLPEIQALYNQGKAAVLANVGWSATARASANELRYPLSREDFQTKAALRGGPQAKDR